ncbi:MAG: YidC/Oxa1 family membrane protein insertase [Candidatus Uhrbacteria bacterium]
MIATLWDVALYQPLLNALFILYDKAAGENLAFAVIELTIAMRIVLLPLSIISESKRARLETLSRQVEDVHQHFRNDPVKQREQTRKILKKNKVNPWAKITVLGVQVLVLVLLYQVFLGGLRHEKLSALYDFVRHPDLINTMFFGFDISVRNVWWAIGVGVVLFIEIAIAQYQRRHALERRDIFYRYAFPVLAVIILIQLPMVKSLFILTSMAFSAILYGVRKGATT